MYFHVLLRLDGVDPDDRYNLVGRPTGIPVADLDAAVHRRPAAHIRYPAASRPAPAGRSSEANKSTYAESAPAKGT
ncbi:hypothetical protein GCM10012279_25020 [Micromonospora yangpuensis]|nr:hypothetical protein GCM10012279_25020 [Micromonospora yangpuensis]